MLVLFGGATYTDLLDTGLRTLAPTWYWLVGVLELLAQVCVPTFFLLFPSGRFVPRWSRWIVLVGFIYELWYVFQSVADLGQANGWNKRPGVCGVDIKPGWIAGLSL
jgi:hypothetical protein